MATKYGPKILAPLATGAVSALGSLGVDKLFAKGVQSGGIIEIPSNKINQLVPFQQVLTNKQKQDLMLAFQNQMPFFMRPTKKQIGSGWAAVLASIGIPTLLDAFKGEKGFLLEEDEDHNHHPLVDQPLVEQGVQG